jgi:acetylornithine deacetylase/succinyl-diaminopimelate desuccinylase-like protein
LRAALADMPDRAPLLREQYGLDQLLNGVSGAALEEQSSFSPTCNIAGLLSGYTGEGIKTVLPARAMVKMDFRLVPNQDPRVIVAALRAHLDAEGFPDVTIHTLGSSAPVTIPLEHPFVRRIAGIAEAFAGRRPAITPLAGGTLPLLEALQRYVGVPGLAAPGDPLYWANGAHAPNEHIRLQDLDNAVRFNAHLFYSLGSA